MLKFFVGFLFFIFCYRAGAEPDVETSNAGACVHANASYDNLSNIELESLVDVLIVSISRCGSTSSCVSPSVVDEFSMLRNVISCRFARAEQSNSTEQERLKGLYEKLYTYRVAVFPYAGDAPVESDDFFADQDNLTEEPSVIGSSFERLNTTSSKNDESVIDFLQDEQ